MLRLGAIVLHSPDSEGAAAFWASALGYTRQDDDPAFLFPPGGAGTRLHLDADDRTHLDLYADGEADQQAQVERLVALGARRVEWDYPDDADDRTHLDLYADGEADQQAQVERLVALGARRVEWDYPDDADFVVLAAPDGTLFCVIA